MTEREPGGRPTPGAPDDTPTVTWTPPGDGTGHETPAAAQPVPTPPRASRARWAIALLVTALVVAVGTAGVMLLTGQSAPSSVVGYAPRDSVVYGEIRLDFPGDQKQKLGQFLAHFPGFQDQSTLDVKIDDVLDRFVLAVSDNRQDWSTRIKPWFGGELGFALGALPAPDEPERAHGLAIASVRDAAAAQAWFDELVADLPHRPADQGGVPLTVFGEGGASGAMAIHDGRTMLVGDEASVRAALDTGGHSGIADEGSLEAALASIDGDGLGYLFFDVRRYADWLEDVVSTMPQASGVPMPALPADLLPDWLLVRVQARGDSIALETVLPHVEAINVVDDNAPGFLAQHVPPTTFAFFDGHEAGATIRNWVDVAKRDPANAEAVRQLEDAVAIVGGWDGLVGWMGDGGVALTRDGGSVAGGAVFQVTDRARADRLLATIRSFVQLGGASAGITIRDEDHNGTTITIVDVGDLADLAPLLGAAAELPRETTLPEGRLELAWAVTDELVVLAPGPAFVRAALDADPGPSLAEDGRYRALLDRVGAANTASAFLDVAAVRELIETLGASDAAGLDDYNRNVKPYLEPLDAIVQAVVRDGDVDRSTTVITVR